MTDLQKRAQIALASLTKSVSEELDKKERLGHYAVVWRDNKIVYLFGEPGNGK